MSSALIKKNPDYLEPEIDTYLTQVCHLERDSEEYALEGIDFFLNVLPMIRVTEENGIITIGGFWARDLEGDVYREWATKRVTNAIFLEMSARSMRFYSFFALEIIYMLEKLKKRDSRTRNSVLDEIITAIYENTWIKAAQEQPPLPMNHHALKRMSVNLLPAQSNFLQHYANNVPRMNVRGTLAAMPPGTGKTITGFAWHLTMGFDTTIFIVPKNSLHEVWEDTVRTRFRKSPKYWISSSNEEPTGREEFIVCHYESLHKVLKATRRLQGKSVGVWLDESHNMNEIKSQRTQNFVRMCLEVDAAGVVFASGSPLKAVGAECVPLLRTIDRTFTEQVERAFVGLYGATKGRALDVLSHRLSRIMFKIDKKTVVDNEVEEYTMQVKIPNADTYTLDAIRLDVSRFIEERLAYYKAEMPNIVSEVNRILTEYAVDMSDHGLIELRRYRNLIDTMHKGFDPFAHKEILQEAKRYENDYILPRLGNADRKIYKRVISRYKYLVLVIRGEALGLVITRRRIECLMDMVPHTPFKQVIDQSEKKTLIFTSYVNVADEIVAHSRVLGYEPLVVYGATNKDLTKIMQRFKDDPKANPMIATYPSLSTAVPVIEANTVMLFDAPFRDYIRSQATSRVNRLGQDSKVHIVNVLLDTNPLDNITTRAKDILEWSKAQTDEMLGLDGSSVEDVSMESISDYANDEVFEISMEGFQDIAMPTESKSDVWYHDVFEIQKYYR